MPATSWALTLATASSATRKFIADCFSIVKFRPRLSQRRPQGFPNLKLGVITRLLSARQLAPRGHIERFLENLAANFFDRLPFLQYCTRIDVDVAVHARQLGIGSHLDHRPKRAANPGAPSRWRGTSFLIQAAASAQLGEMLAARQALGEAQRLWPLDTVRTRYVEGPASSAHKAQYSRYQDALRLVGYRDHADPDADYGVPSDDHLHGDLVGLTPTTVPGAKTILTAELQSLLAERNPLVVDTMLYTWGHSIPGAIGLAGRGRGGVL